jgi:hypothetical protein
MNFEDAFEEAPKVLDKLTRELLSRADRAVRKNERSQLTACLLVALRSASMAFGMARVLDVHTLDSYETLTGAASEAIGLLMRFRFADEGTKHRTACWFAGLGSGCRKTDQTKVDRFLSQQDLIGITPVCDWGTASLTSLPTKYQADSSTAVIVDRLEERPDAWNFKSKRADYILTTSRLILATAYDFRGWIPLGLAGVERYQLFRREADLVAASILSASIDRHVTDEVKRRAALLTDNIGQNRFALE